MNNGIVPTLRRGNVALTLHRPFVGTGRWNVHRGPWERFNALLIGLSGDDYLKGEEDAGDDTCLFNRDNGSNNWALELAA